VTGQRYVSKELTHFVGKGLSEEEQYSVLVNSILKGGWLRHSPNAEGPQGPTELLETGAVHAMRINKFAPIDEMYAQTVVCFCDIPVSDFEIHMGKYSRFGLSFLKPFLVDKGASPVFYIAKDSRGHALRRR
jgi:hypothetical protein